VKSTVHLIYRSARLYLPYLVKERRHKSAGEPKRYYLQRCTSSDRSQ